MSSMAANSTDLRAQQLVSSYVRAGYTPIDPPIVQPAEPFLDLSGEDIRRRMFLTSDPLEHELCLRPDLTIPLHYNDYDIFREPLDEFARAVERAGLKDKVRTLSHGETYAFAPRGALMEARPPV